MNRSTPGRQRDGTGDASAGAFDGVRDFAGGLVYDPEVICLEADSDALCSHIKSNFIVMVVLNSRHDSTKADAKYINCRFLCNKIIKKFWLFPAQIKRAGTFAPA